VKGACPNLLKERLVLGVTPGQEKYRLGLAVDGPVVAAPPKEGEHAWPARVTANGGQVRIPVGPVGIDAFLEAGFLQPEECGIDIAVETEALILGYRLCKPPALGRGSFGWLLHRGRATFL
jgi:hypothetical protein